MGNKKPAEAGLSLCLTFPSRSSAPILPEIWHVTFVTMETILSPQRGGGHARQPSRRLNPG